MSFDSATRNRLATFVREARTVIADEFTQQFQALYGISSSGSITPMDQLRDLDEAGRAIAALLRERIDYLISSYPSEKNAAAAAVSRLAREQSFTILNRLAAIRMAEKRKLIEPSVGKGYQSAGFRVYESVAGTGLGDAYHRYRFYLFCLFDELAVDLGILFDRRSASGLLFPREPALLRLLELLNAHQIEELWAEDETIGWIYQYFNDEAERKKMRDTKKGGSDAPRNSYELAVRNQFFTPRYVVEFLTDNTLGRLWYEMTRGATVLRERCRYLVRRPTEIFLNPGQSASESAVGSEAKAGENLSQEELLRQPVHIPHRPLKDPREVRLLDPACGSMHFGLYAFDIFTDIYDEAWEIAHGTDDAAKAVETFAPFVTFASSFPDKAAFLREVPRLIVERNIHGIDIDPRAAQIAGLSLWLRAQRAWLEAGVKPADRPRITRSNLVCAEPMPGDKELLREFIEQQFPVGERPAFAFLLGKIFDCMTLAGEAGSLLRIEEEIRAVIAEAKRLWKEGPKHEQASLFAGAGETPGQGEMHLDLSGITDEQFWGRAEQRIYEALETYSEQAENGGFQRRLFADDAAQGFAFIDLCRKLYDVAVMNPPFGESTTGTKQYLTKAYKDYAVELYCAFLIRNHGLLEENGLVGCITSSSFVLYTDFADYRDALLSAMRLEALVNLGEGVLDGAYVYTASYITRKAAPPPLIGFYDLRFSNKKETDLLGAVQHPAVGGPRYLSPAHFDDLPSKPLCHWASDALFNLARRAPKLGSFLDDAGVGAAPQSDFFNLYWEVPPSVTGFGKRWVPIANGGSFSPYGRTDFLVVDWENHGRRAVADLNNRYPYLNGNVGIRIQRTHLYGHRGLTYGKRTDRFNAQVLRGGSIFTFEGIGVFPSDDSDEYLLGLLAILNTRFVAYWLNLTAGLHKNDVYIRRLPFPYSPDETRSLANKARRVHQLTHEALAVEEINHFFTGALFAERKVTSLRQAGEEFRISDRLKETELLMLISEVENFATVQCSLDEGVLREVADDQGIDPCTFEEEAPTELLPIPTQIAKGRPGFCRWFETASDLYRVSISKSAHPKAVCAALNAARIVEDETLDWLTRSLVSYAVGCAFGRWDIRYATGERPAPELPDPFAPLPVCPPGMLQTDDGLPLSPEEGRQFHAAGKYPLDVAWDGILVDDTEHRLDLERRVHAALTVLWGDRAGELEHEACTLLGVPNLREWFCRPSGFFADHLKRYSKSRRQAPIYWPLSTASGRYTLWLYYPRLTDQTLHTALADFLDPKLRSVQSQIRAMKDTNGSRTKLEELLDLEAELTEMRTEIDRIIRLPWKPNLNDGVLISASPLWQLFRFGPWRNGLQACWQELQDGDYDWAHLAYTLRPEQVRQKCKKDRSLAIAHGLESICEVEAPKPKAKRGKKAKAESAKETPDFR